MYRQPQLIRRPGREGPGLLMARRSRSVRLHLGHRRSGQLPLPLVSPLQESVDGSCKRLGDVRAAPGERRARVDAEPGEDAGERLGLEEGARDLFVSAGAGRRVRVNDGPRRGALSLELSQDCRSGRSGPGSLHAAGCIAVARRWPVRTATELLAAPLAEKDLELAHALMVADASPEPVTEHPSSCNRLCASNANFGPARGGRQAGSTEAGRRDSTPYPPQRSTTEAWHCLSELDGYAKRSSRNQRLLRRPTAGGCAVGSSLCSPATYRRLLSRPTSIITIIMMMCASRARKPWSSS